jgi:UDPglucose 6-dehydrogenase
VGVDPRILDAVDAVNDHQKHVLIGKLKQQFNDCISGLTLAMWGLAFKPRTDDIREAPALVLIDHMLAAGCKLQVHDPEAMKNVQQLYGDKLRYANTPLDALEGADALCINTEWSDFRNPDFEEMKRRLRLPIIFDGRNLYEPETMRHHGFIYHSIGRVPVM